MKSKLIFDTFTVTTAETMGGVTYRQTLNAGVDLQYGCAAMAEVSFAVRAGAFDKGVFEGKKFTLQISQTGDGTDNYQTVGIFTVQTVEKAGMKLEITAYDNMIKFERYADEFLSSLKYPTTMRNVLTAACTYCGVTLDAAALTNLVNLDLTIPTNISMGNGTMRNLLAYIAEAGVCYMYVDTSGRLTAARYKETSISLDRTKYVSCKLSEFAVDPINDAVVNTAFGLRKVTGGDNAYYVPSNPIISTYDNSVAPTAVETIYNTVKDFTYTPAEITLFQDFGIHAGDIITVNGVKSIVMDKKMTSGGVTLTSTGTKKREAKVDNVVTIADLSPYVKTDQLSAQIGSYLDSESGQASIVSAASGVFVTNDEFTTVQTNISQSISSLESEISLEAAYGSGTIGSNVRALLTLFADQDSSSIRLNANAISLTSSTGTRTPAGTLVTPPNVVYPFSMDTDGYYKSNNKGKDSSFSYGKIEFNFSETTEIVVTCINDSENNFDYGLISEVDHTLSQTNSADANGVLKSFKGLSDDPVEVKMTIPSGYHYFTAKYIKDSSQAQGYDLFKFKVEKVTSKSASISLNSGGTEISNADIDLSGMVSFTDLSQTGKTTINGDNITTGKISSQFIETENIKIDRLYAKGTNDLLLYVDYTLKTMYIGALNDRATMGWSECENIEITVDRTIHFVSDVDSTAGFAIYPITGSPATEDGYIGAGFFPVLDNTGFLGDSNHRWRDIYATSAHINTIYYGDLKYDPSLKTS